MAAAFGIDVCVICTDPLKAPRILHCQHIFCLDCLEKLEKNKTINCPICREDTVISEGLHVRHLRRKQVRSHTAGKSRVSRIKSWTLEHMITDVMIDEEAGIIYLATGDEQKPIQMYGMMGEYTGHLSGDRNLQYARLGLDTKRGLLLAVSNTAVILFDSEGSQVGRGSPQFKHLNNVSYHAKKDVYIIADIGEHCLFYINPDTCQVIKKIPAATDSEIRSNTPISCDKTGGHAIWATADWEANIVRLYDAEGICIKAWDREGSGFGQLHSPAGVYVGKNGTILLSDNNNHRIVRLDPDSLGEKGEWKVVVNTKQFNLGAPRMIDITEDGLAAVVMWSKEAGPFNLAIINGLV